MNSTTNPVLEGKGVGLSLSILQPCGIILPHLHPRASKIMYSIDGENIMIGFIQENGAPTVFNTLRKGEAAFVPQGAIMFFQNLGCKPVTQVLLLLINNYCFVIFVLIVSFLKNEDIWIQS